MKTGCRLARSCACLALLSSMAACAAPLAASSIPAAMAATATPAAPNMPAADHGRLIFDEEFSGDQLNRSYWSTEYSWGPINEPELQYYSPDALHVQDGILRITAEKRPTGGMPYSSGMIASFDRFTFVYGYVEMRARIPSGQGLWPAFWLHLNDDNKTGEIDIFEVLGHQPHILFMSYHLPELGQFWFNGPDYSQDYHVYAVDWEPGSLAWYVDGIERARVEHATPSEPMYILVNLAVGGTWPGSPNASTHFPAYYDVDYIRVYQH